MKRLKILVSAYACSPFRGSEPGVGWGFISELAKHHDLWVMVEEEEFREEIERYLVENPDFGRNVHFYFFRKPRNRLLRKLWPPSYYWYYRRWHQQAFNLAQKLHREVGFDLVHQLTMVGFREPGYLWQLGVPFVWGPVGGMGLFPWRFLSSLGLYGFVYYLGYNLINAWQMRFARRPRLAARAAGTGLLAATPENLDGAARYWGVKCGSLLCEVGLPAIAVTLPSLHDGNSPLRIVWTGQHTRGKALNLGLKALSELPSNLQWELHVLGKGEMTAPWECLSKDLGIQDRCIFHGWQPRSSALKVMQNCHVMLITSLRDLTATVTIEALAMGLPIVCLDHCGFAGVVNADCGIKIPVTSPAATIADLSAAIQTLATDELQRRRLAMGAIRRAQDFSWEKKVSVLNEIYALKLAEKERADASSSDA